MDQQITPEVKTDKGKQPAEGIIISGVLANLNTYTNKTTNETSYYIALEYMGGTSRIKVSPVRYDILRNKMGSKLAVLVDQSVHSGKIYNQERA
jgi:hypothetical protein